MTPAWMLFHPYERRFGVHGAIPKTKARLANRIGRTVGEKLLTSGDVLEELRRAGVPAMVERKVVGFDMVRIEEIVRSVTQRELTLIVRLGYLLGALIGLVSFLGRRLLAG